MAHPGGRPTKYTKELSETICEKLANGNSLASICRLDEMPERATVHRWLVTDKEFCDRYKVAREIQAEVYADEMENIAIEEEDVQRARLRIDTRKWIASKLKPKKYGDKIDVTTDGKALPAPIIPLDV